MPYASKAQVGYLHAKKPEVAARFDKETPKGSYKHLPQHVGKAIHGLKPHLPKGKSGRER